MNTQELYRQATGVEDPAVPDEVREKQIQDANAAQKELEMWAQWRQHPVTQIFIKRVTDARNKILGEVITNTTNVPAVSNDWIRSKLVTSNALTIIMTKTVMDGSVFDNEQS